MEMELEPRVKPLSYKIKGMSRESPAQKATHILDSDLRNHWSTATNTKEWILLELDGMSRESPAQKATHILDSDLRNHWSTATNTKEWILLELDEPCLLSHIRIYNKSVLEWEIAVGLRYKPETFVKVRPRCEAPRRDMMYPMNYTPCRYVRISCLRGNPIAIFFIQLIGVSVTGLEPEFQPIVNHLLPQIISHKQDVHDLHLQLLQDLTNRLVAFLPQLEVDLSSFSDDPELNLRFLAMLAGPFYPILHIVNERESARLAGSILDSDAPKNSQPSSALTVSSNFEPRRSRSASPFSLPTASSLVFRADTVFILLRKAYRDSHLGTFCRMASRILLKLVEPQKLQQGSIPSSDVTCSPDEASKSELSNPPPLVDYSNLFGEEFQIPDDYWDTNYLAVLDVGAVEEGILHVLYACASQPLLCSKLADNNSDFWSALPLVQALLPALRPNVISPDHIDDSFSQWKQPFVQHALSQIVATSSLPVYRPLLHVCAGYLSSFSPSHAKAACVLIDLCSGVLAPWMAQLIAKVDLTLELLEDLLGVIQGARHSLARPRARAAIKYIILALSGHMDDVLLSILEPYMRLPPEIDHCMYPFSEPLGQETLNVSLLSSVPRSGGASLISNSQDDADGKTDVADTSAKMDILEDASLFFAPSELRSMALTSVSGSPDKNSIDLRRGITSTEDKHVVEKNLSKLVNNGLALDAVCAVEYFDLHADYMQLINYQDCELRASEFQRLALDLRSQHEISREGHDAAIDALLLSAECYVNPFFMLSFRDTPKDANRINVSKMKISEKHEFAVVNGVLKKNDNELETVAHLERRRDKIVLQILLEAAELDRNYQKTVSNRGLSPVYAEENEEVLSLSQHDMHSADAITLVRQNQALLCNFLIQRLQKEQHSMHEILLQSLLFLLQSATKLFCSPEDVVDIILGSAEHFNGLLTSFYHQYKEGNLQLDSGKVHELQRRWMLLQRLVIASSGGDEGPEFSINTSNGFRFANLIPSSAWVQQIPTFSSCTSPLVRFLGWMAVSRNAKHYLKEWLFLVSDLSQLTNLLSIFADELAIVDNIAKEKDEDKRIGQPIVKDDKSIGKGFEFPGQQYADQSFRAIYPTISQFFPSMRKQFEAFGEIILEAVGLQLRSLSSGVVPDLLCWFSDLCSWPFFQKGKDKFLSQNNSLYFKGFVAKNAKAIILYTLEAIMIEHMEAMVPEMPRVVQVLVSLSRTSYCDVSFLDSILRLLKPLISYSLQKVSVEEKLLIDDSCVNFESLCFDELFTNIRHSNENKGTPLGKIYNGALTIFILASVFPDLSFQRKREILQSLVGWGDFVSSEPTTYFHDYLCAFQTVMESCKILLAETLKVFGLMPLNMHLYSDNSSESHYMFLHEVFESSCAAEVSEKPESNSFVGVISCQKICHFSVDEIEDFSKDLDGLICKINPTIERCWKIHHQLAKKITLTSAKCLIYSRCLSSFAHKAFITAGIEDESILPSESVDQSDHWKIALEGFTETIMVLQETHCWEVASVMLDCILGVPRCFCLDSVIDTICTAIKNFMCSGPTIAWRLQTDKWLSYLFARDIDRLHNGETPLVNLLCAMLGHPEPEQRFISLQHLGRLIGQDVYNGTTLLSSISHDKPSIISVSEAILKPLVSSTWDQVAVVASSDTSLLLRTRAMAVLVDYVPFAERHQLQSLLASADSVLYGLGRFAHSTCEGPLVQLSLALLASICLHSPVEDISVIPQVVWKNIETLGMSSNGKRGDAEKKTCQALCRLKYEGDEAKENLKEVLSSSSSEQVGLDFGSTRESILQVLSNLTSVQSYFDFFSKKIDQKDMELEEAEMELNLLQKEQTDQESSKDSKEWSYVKDDDRLQQIKDSIRSLEKSKLREEIIARRQKKLLVRHARHKYLEEAALREAELLQELDRERTTEVEREIERQRSLELERTKTRELRHHLDMEKEKQSQRELQRELEQVESGLRPSRREFSTSTHSSRPRDRYRERENGRSSTEGSLRAISGGLQTEMATPSVVLSGSRPFSGQVPTILQSRDRLDECGSSYEENFDGSKDSGDTGSVGDPDLVSAFEGQPGGIIGSTQRHGSRGSKSRQMMERRERDGGRREGKWERKH
ncbi:Protein efr3 like [Actinidia chinensis var. chinensis]|uniref:Protein efr3 like n=1 Tax=Actinidia chinensis var. chinensis TaxID=1590841 RepID=A0A2R6RAG6_ACTCC|nr:Protein efr3 like [Actinidia chinensis var. chinensis]